MDSLLATYASSDEDEPQQRPDRRHERSSNSSSSSLPPARPSIPLFSALPRPKSSSSSSSSPSPSIFSSSLPPPKSQTSTPHPLSNPNPKRIIQIKPPLLPTYPDDEDDDEEARPRKSGKSTAVDSSSVKSFLSSIPAPKSSSALGALPSASSSGRRSILDTNSAPSSIADDASADVVPDESVATVDSGFVDYSYYQSYDDAGASYGPGMEQPVGNSGEGGGYYEHNWSEEAMAQPTVDASASRFFRGKRGRNEIPEIIEVKQEELTKNRPREDQAKSTGIAFGPAYQPVASGKGKPTKLHKRKHQIGSLYFEMRQKEMELTERRAKGFLTKAQTHAKYGW